MIIINRLQDQVVQLRELFKTLNSSVANLRAESVEGDDMLEKKMTRINSLVQQFSNSVGRGRPMNMSLLTETILKQIGQILNPASISGEPIPFPGLGKAYKYIKHIYQPVRSLDLIGGKTNIMMTPQHDFNFWQTKAFTYGKSDCYQFRLDGVKQSADENVRSTVMYGVTSIGGAPGRFTVPQCAVRESIKILFDVVRSGGFTLESQFNGSVVIKRSADPDLVVEVVKGIRYWLGHNGTLAPVGGFDDATINIGLNDIVGFDLQPADDDASLCAVCNFDENQIDDVNWYWAIQSNLGYGWEGKINPATALNPVFRTELNTAMSGWLANDAPALYKGGELMMARVTGLGIPPLGNSDYPTWISSINNHSASFPLAKGGYQYHVPSLHADQDVVHDCSPFILNSDKYFYAIDYSVTVDGNIPNRLPCHFLMAYVNGYAGMGNFANVSAAPAELGFGRAISMLYSNYLPLENSTHLSQLVDRGLSVANDLYSYGKKIFTSPVTQQIMNRS